MVKYIVKYTAFFVVMYTLFLNQAFGLSPSSKEWRVLIQKIPRISAELAYIRYKSGKVIFADSMNARTYAKYHILGAISLPGDGPADLARITKAKLPISRNTAIMVYCD